MRMCNEIIKGSQKWVERVPDEYAIKHIEAYISPVEKSNMILKFSYVKNCCGLYGAGFTRKIGMLRVDHNVGEFIEGIVILINDVSMQPSVFYKEKDNISYKGQLEKCEVDNIVYKPLEFSNVIHYSARTLEKQKSDEDAPEWLKNLAETQGANVAYFEF